MIDSTPEEFPNNENDTTTISTRTTTNTPSQMQQQYNVPITTAASISMKVKGQESNLDDTEGDGEEAEGGSHDVPVGTRMSHLSLQDGTSTTSNTAQGQTSQLQATSTSTLPNSTQSTSSTSSTKKRRKKRSKRKKQSVDKAAAETAAVYYGECYMNNVGANTADMAAKESHWKWKKWWNQEFDYEGGEVDEDADGNGENCGMSGGLVSSVGDGHVLPRFAPLSTAASVAPTVPTSSMLSTGVLSTSSVSQPMGRAKNAVLSDKVLPISTMNATQTCTSIQAPITPIIPLVGTSTSTIATPSSNSTGIGIITPSQYYSVNDNEYSHLEGSATSNINRSPSHHGHTHPNDTRKRSRSSTSLSAVSYWHEESRHRSSYMNMNQDWECTRKKMKADSSVDHDLRMDPSKPHILSTSVSSLPTTTAPSIPKLISNETTAQRIQTIKNHLLTDLERTNGDVTSPTFLHSLNQLRTFYHMSGWDARYSSVSNQVKGHVHQCRSHDSSDSSNSSASTCNQKSNMSIDTSNNEKVIEGVWLTLSRPHFAECLGKNKHGDYMYTLGRMSFDMFRPNGLVLSIQGIFNTVDFVHGDDKDALKTLMTSVPKSLRQELTEENAVLRHYNIITAFTVESGGNGFGPYSPNSKISKPIRGIMSTIGYVIPDPNTPNRLSVWFTEGKIEINDKEPETIKEWKKIFDVLPRRQLQEKARVLAAKLLLGATVPEEIEQDGSMSYHFKRPIGGHGTAYIDHLYLDDTLRIVQGHRGSIFVFAKDRTRHD